MALSGGRIADIGASASTQLFGNNSDKRWPSWTSNKMCFFLVGKPRSFQFFPTMAWGYQSRLGPWDHLGTWLVGAWSTTRRKFLHVTGFTFIQPGGLLQLLGEPRSFQLYEIEQAELVLVQSGVVLPLIVNCVVELSVFHISFVAQGMNFLHQRQVGRRWDWRACCFGRILWSSLPQTYLGEPSGPEKHLCWCQSNGTVVTAPKNLPEMRSQHKHGCL